MVNIRSQPSTVIKQSKIVTDSGESVDFGCPVDAELISDSENPYENFYDMTRLSELMNEYYAALDEAA
jgi:hypothetical protein